jgi:hypothetical protein
VSDSDEVERAGQGRRATEPPGVVVFDVEDFPDASTGEVLPPARTPESSVVTQLPSPPSFDAGRILAAARALEAEAQERVARLRRQVQEKAAAPAATETVPVQPKARVSTLELAVDAVELVGDDAPASLPPPRKPAAAPPPVPRRANSEPKPARVAAATVPLKTATTEQPFPAKRAKTEPGARPRLPGLPPTRPPTNRPISANESSATVPSALRRAFDAFAAFETSDET